MQEAGNTLSPTTVLGTLSDSTLSLEFRRIQPDSHAIHSYCRFGVRDCGESCAVSLFGLIWEHDSRRRVQD